MSFWEIKRSFLGWCIAVGFTACMHLLLADECGAQPFALGEWVGSYESLLQIDRQETEARGAQSGRYEGVLSINQLNLANRGAYIYHPRLLSLSFGGQFGLSQNWRSGTGEHGSQLGTLWGYDFLATILPENKFSLDLYANRSQSVYTGDFTARHETVAERYGATLYANRMYIPSILDFYREFRNDETRLPKDPSLRQENRTVFRYSGNRGWIDREMRLIYEFNDFADEISARNSFQSHDASIYYSMDFGPELNRRWDSQVRFLTRSGTTPLTNLWVNESLQIDHSDQLSTRYGYDYTYTETSGGAVNSHLLRFDLTHKLYQNLTTTFGLSNTFATLPDGQTENASTNLNFNYTKSLPHDGRLTIGLGGGFQYQNNRFSSTESFVPQEFLTFGTPFALPLSLQNPFVVPTSVVVTKVALGPIPPGCFASPVPSLLVVGQDYTVQSFGDITEIVPIPCSGLTSGVNPGDTIAVEYRFTVSPSRALTTLSWHATAGVDYGWIRGYMNHSQSDQTQLSGSDGRYLVDQRSDTLGLEFRYRGNRLSASTLGELFWFSSSYQEYVGFRSNQSATVLINPGLTLNLNASESLTDSSKPERQTATLSGKAALDYRILPTLSVNAFAGLSLLKSSDQPNERITEAGLGLRWMYRKVEVLPSLELWDQKRGETGTNRLRIMLRMIRRF